MILKGEIDGERIIQTSVFTFPDKPEQFVAVTYSGKVYELNVGSELGHMDDFVSND